jgi:hypothetical protein
MKCARLHRFSVNVHVPDRGDLKVNGRTSTAEFRNLQSKILHQNSFAKLTRMHEYSEHVKWVGLISYAVVGLVTFVGDCARGILFPVLWPFCEELGKVFSRYLQRNDLLKSVFRRN